MGFAQLYYTSCEHGLSGYAGYQFNAATPGVDPRVLREIERFTVYEPPRSSLPEHVDEHPVNLCYSPDVGGVPVLSRVISSGDDPSGRPGNYFAHSLVSSTPGTGPLPAELWEADFWVETPVDDPAAVELSELTESEVGPGPLDRERTDSWVRRWSPEVVARLLLAVDGAVDGARPLALVADSASVAHWVAALTHLMPPERSRMLSFSTYCGNPGEAFVHVVGVPPGSDTAPWRDRFTVYDPELGSLDDLPVPRPRAWAVAERLARLGTRRAAAMWRQARSYASGREASLADWRPVLAAVSLLREWAAPVEDLRAVREWLPEAVEWLAPEDAATLIHRILDADTTSECRSCARSACGPACERESRPLVAAAVGGPGGSGPGDFSHATGAGLAVKVRGASEVMTLDHGALAGLQKVAHRVDGVSGITDRIERVMVRRSLDDIAAGRAAPLVDPVRSESVRETARERVAALLSGERDEVAPERAVELLRWARAGGLAPPTASLERYGDQVLAPLLSGSLLPDPAVRTLITSHAGIRRGAATGLAQLPRDRLATLAAGPVGALFADDRDGSTAVLRELRLLGTDDRTDPPDLLSHAVAVRREGRTARARGIAAYDVDEDLLTQVWGPDHGPRTALLTLRVLRPGTLVAPEVGGWVSAAITSAPASGQERAWRELVDEVSGHWLRVRLPEPGQRVLAEWSQVRPALVALRAAGDEEGPDRLEAVHQAIRETHPAVREITRRLAARMLLGWRRCAPLAEALRDCPEEVFEAYCQTVTLRLADERPDTATAALVYQATGQESLVGHERARYLETVVLTPAVAAWKRRHVARMRRQLSRESGGAFDEWASHVRGPRARGLFGLGRRAGGGRP